MDIDRLQEIYENFVALCLTDIKKTYLISALIIILTQALIVTIKYLVVGV